MFTLVQKAVGYFSGVAPDSDLQSERPKLEDFISVSSFESENFEGMVTSVSDRNIIINSDVYFTIPLNQSKCKFKVGDCVQGIAERKTKFDAWRAVSVSLRICKEGWDADLPGLTGEAIPCRDLEAGIPGILKNDLFSSNFSKPKILSSPPKQPSQVKTYNQKTVIGKVMAIHADTVTLNADTYFNISAAKSAFDLMEGDWVVCKLGSDSATSQPHNHLPGFINVSHVEPLRKKKIKGEVSHRYASYCVINNEIFCSSKLTRTAPVQVGDAVVMEVIESNQIQFGWRALSLCAAVMPPVKELMSGNGKVLSKIKELEDVKLANLLKDKHNISISHSVRFPQIMIGSTSHMYVCIRNNGTETHTLCRVYFVSASQECQFSVAPNSIWDNGAPVKILPDTGITVRLICTGKLLGFFKQLCIFDFDKFLIGRYVSVAIGSQHINNMTPAVPYIRNARQKRSCIQSRNDQIIRGERPFKSPAFLPACLPSYHVPSELWTAIENEQNVLDVAPTLREPIDQENHQEVFSLLLHLEEIEMTLQMRQFDMTRVSFSSHGEYLSLTVAGLAERRPSLMIGDTVIASNPCNIGGTEYEGYIHEVLHTQVLLKFHPSFHNQYNGEDYAVRFNFNRTPLRRCHFALNFAMEQLGGDVLFPKKLKFQLPQISYVDPEALSSNGKRKTEGCNHEKMSSQQRNSCIAKEFDTDKEKNRNASSVRDSRNTCTVGENQAKKHFKDGKSSLSKIMCSDITPCAQKVLPETFDVFDTANYRLQNAIDAEFISEHDGAVKDRIDLICDINELHTTKANNCNPKISEESKKTHLSERISIESVVKCNVNESFDNIIKRSSETDNSPDSIRIVPKKGNGVTPPRVPVVTRLFGVPSSGSSANSSMCCSDDESKSNHELDNDIKVKRNGNEGRIINNTSNGTNNDEGQKKNTYKDSSSEISVLLSSRENHATFKRKLENCPVEMSNMANTDLYHPVKEGSRADIPKISLQQDVLGSSHFSGMHSTHRVDSKTLQITPVLKHPEQVVASESEWSKNCSVLIRQDDACIEKARSKLHLSSSQAQVQNQRRGESIYYTPIFPVRSSVERKIKSKQIPILKWVNKELNLEQKLAVRRILEGSTRPLPYIIYGPPGTGKTVTLVESVLQIFTMIHHSRLLIVTPSNSAADLVTERLIMCGQLEKSDLIRLNAYQRKDDSIPETIRPFCYNGDQLAFRVRQRLIITTATTAGILYTLGLHNGHFTHVFVDEAGQLTEPECLVALGLVNHVSGQLVLAGDPQQLGPVVQSRLAKKFGMQDSLLHRLCSSVVYQPEEKNESAAWIYEPRLLTQLVKNYRSHPDIFATPSKLFYHGSLQAHASIEITEKLLSWDELPNSSCPLLFHGLVSENCQEGDSPSWFNPAEAFQVVRYAKSLINFGVEAANIGIITPYRKQVQKIRKLLTSFGIAEGIKIGTVEEFQGQEKSAIIVSTVRSSEQLLEIDQQHSLGFVKCQRRFNVAITRAQSLLVVVGNPMLLALDSCWMDFLCFCVKKNAYRGPELSFMD